MTCWICWIRRLIIYGNRFGAWDENEGDSLNTLKVHYPNAYLLFYQVEGDTFGAEIFGATAKR